MVSWYIFAIISAIFFGFQAVLLKLILTEGLNFALVTTYFFTIVSIILWVYILFMERIVIPDRPIIILLLLTSFVAVAANLALFKSYSLVSNPGYTRAVVAISIIVAFVISIFLFNLKLDLIGMLGVSFIVVGAVLLSMVI